MVSVIGADEVARGEIPFLQAYASNAVAIGTYERLGFKARRTLNYTTVKRR